MQHLFKRIRDYKDNLNPELRTVIGIDGRCGGGKTTLANLLSKEFNAPIIHMDHFFLPLTMRTEKRLSIPGENVHHERFAVEVSPSISSKNPFVYQGFDCATGELSEHIMITESDFAIVEGSYSMHPSISPMYDFTVFLDISPEEQRQRLIAREGFEGYRIFQDKWIPLEELYFSFFGIPEKCDIKMRL